MLFNKILFILSLAAGSARVSALSLPLEDSLLVPRQQGAGKPGPNQQGQPKQGRPQQGQGQPQQGQRQQGQPKQGQNQPGNPQQGQRQQGQNPQPQQGQRQQGQPKQGQNQQPQQGQRQQGQNQPGQPQQQAQGQSHVVVVGSLQDPNAVTFTPNAIQAAPGDTVQYQFVSANHTATQAAGAQSPCKPANNAVNSMFSSSLNFESWCFAGRADLEFIGGFMPVQQGAQRVKTFTMVVQDTQPMYMYCAAANHCQQGMVMTINAASADTRAFQSAAKKARNNVAANNVNGGNAGRIATSQVGKQ
ncbi:hypothetical protein VTL71DRAFT_12167 [Oculimacula yallundae]|uniref:Extracellular serine-rich protein n=1 Tax=Oculimacula yallundae TaxID=86028 RepID=A0ABR4CSH1_9HELO